MFKLKITAALGLMISASAFSHHSYAPYDIRNPIEISGVVEDFVYRRPHPMLTLLDNEGVEWEIEIPILFWDRYEYGEDTVKQGDELIVLGWPARNGRPDMALSGFTLAGDFYPVLERIGQQFANEAADRIEAGEDLESVLEDTPPEGTGWQERQGRQGQQGQGQRQGQGQGRQNQN